MTDASRIDHGWRGRFARYAAGSVVSTCISEVVLIGAYSVFNAGPQTAALLAWVAGGAPNYLLNRQWAWRRQGKADLWTETLPYWLVTLATGTAAVLVTGLVDNRINGAIAGRGDRSLLLGLAYFTVYGVVFLFRFVVFDRWVFDEARERAS